MACYRGEYVPNHPQFAEGSAALCRGEIGPVEIAAPDIAYTEEDEKAIDAFTRKFGENVVLVCLLAGVLISVVMMQCKRAGIQ